MTSAKFRRPRATKLTYLTFGVFGWYFYALGPAMNFLRDDHGTSAFVMSLHMAVISATSIIGGAIVPHLVARIGRGQTLRLSGYTMAFGVTLFLLGSNSVFTLVAAAILGLASTSTVTLSSAFIDQSHGEHAPVALAEGNMVAAAAGLISPLAMGLAVALGFGWRIGLAVTIFMFLVIELLRGNPADFNQSRVETKKNQKVHLPRNYWWAWSILIATTGTEYMIVLWSTELLRERAGLGEAAAAAGLAAFTGGLALGRLFLARLAKHFNAETLLEISLLIPLLSFWGMWLSQSAVVMLISLTVFGVGAGMHWPLGIARLVKAGGAFPDAASSRSAYATGGAGIVLPVVLGALADSFGVHGAFLLVPAVLLAGWLIVRFGPNPNPTAV